MLKGESLVGAIVYYDGRLQRYHLDSLFFLVGQQNDSRMNVALALTAAYHGAALANHVEVTGLMKGSKNADGEPRLSGAKVRDSLTGQEWEIKAKGIVNATGPFTGTLDT